jgi:hypothetical protein|nr:MAG TPA: hypothetical protein [Caudoviricetes sp.]
MDLLWFFIGIFIILCIGRYNESNKLFWVLLVSFVGSFAVATVIVKSTSHNSDETKKSTVQVCPTQASTNTSGITHLADAMLGDILSSQLKPVGKDKNTLESLRISFNSPLFKSGIVYSPLKPPQLCLHTSIHHDNHEQIQKLLI